MPPIEAPQKSLEGNYLRITPKWPLQRTGAACVAKVDRGQTAAGDAPVTVAAADPQTHRQPLRQSRLLLARPSCGGGFRPRRSLSLRSLGVS